MIAILMSDRPEWVAKILNGEKPIEIRKTAPKCELPIDVYIHCTAPNSKGGVIGRFDSEGNHICYNRKVVAKFTLRKVEDLRGINSSDGFSILERACLDYDEYLDYLYKGREGAYAWYISDLVIFDKPMELSEFRYKKVTRKWDKNYHNRIVKKEIIPVKRAPQSWQYVEV